MTVKKPPAIDADVAIWLRDEVLAACQYQGGPDALRDALDRHERAFAQLSGFIPDP